MPRQHPQQPLHMFFRSRFWRHKRRLSLAACAALLSLWPGPAQAIQVILNQPLSTVKRYLGPFRQTYPASDETGRPQSVEREFGTQDLRALIPELSPETSLSVLFVNNRAQRIRIHPMDRCHHHPGADTEPCESPEITAYSEQLLGQLYFYLFREQPTGFAYPPGWYGGGHEGYWDHGFCLGQGIQVAYTEYYGIGQMSPIDFTYNPACK